MRFCYPTVIPTTCLVLIAVLAGDVHGKSALKVIDGDTVVINGEVIRIANIDAPEIGHAKCDAEKRLGVLAKVRLEALLRGAALVIAHGDPIDGRTVDRHGRSLATIATKGQDVGQILIDEGLARPWQGKRKPWC